MADAQDAQDRNLPASPQRLEKARKEGQVARSRDLGHFAALAAGGGALTLAAPALGDALSGMLARALRFDGAALARPAFMGERLGELALTLIAVALPLVLMHSQLRLAHCRLRLRLQTSFY